jgi:DNA invertase Pin-like site-specific DNA recombinase
LRVVGYARLSTQEQAEGQALEQQIDRLRKAGATAVIQDLDSGAKDHREGFTRLLEMVRTRQVDRVVAVRLDRLSRRAATTCELADLFGADDAPELMLLDDGIDARTIGGRTMIRVLGALAQQELERIRERAEKGRAYRLAQRRTHHAPWGLLLQPDGSLTLHPEQQEAAQRAWHEWNTDHSHYRMERWCHAAADTPNWTARGFLVWALNPALRGAFVAGVGRRGMAPTWETVVEDQFPPLIDPAIHRAAVARWMAEHRAGQLPSTKRKHALSGLVRCAGCGGAMHRGGQCKSTGMAVRFNCRRATCPQLNKNGIREDHLWPHVAAALINRRHEITGLLLGNAERADQQTPSPDAEALARLKDQRSQLMQLQQQGLPVADALRAVEREEAAVKAAAVASQGTTARAIAQLGQEILGGDAGAADLMLAVLVQALQESYPAPLLDDWTAAIVRVCVGKVVVDQKQVASVALTI